MSSPERMTIGFGWSGMFFCQKCVELKEPADSMHCRMSSTELRESGTAGKRRLALGVLGTSQAIGVLS